MKYIGMLVLIAALINCYWFTKFWKGDRLSVKWWHFWNPHSGIIGGLIACLLILIVVALAVLS